MKYNQKSWGRPGNEAVEYMLAAYKSMSTSELFVKVTMKSRSIASGMMTGTMGTTVGGRNNL